MKTRKEFRQVTLPELFFGVVDALSAGIAEEANPKLHSG
jgi:hypothetical protein